MTQDEMLRWGSMVADLRANQIGLTHKQRCQFLERFHVEIGLLCVWLNRLRVTGGEAEVLTNLPDTCAQCGIDLRLEGLAVDGATHDGSWKHLCMGCFGESGTGIGWGVGQLYRHEGQCEDGIDRWKCIAGGDPRIKRFE